MNPPPHRFKPGKAFPFQELAWPLQDCLHLGIEPETSHTLVVLVTRLLPLGHPRVVYHFIRNKLKYGCSGQQSVFMDDILYIQFNHWKQHFPRSLVFLVNKMEPILRIGSNLGLHKRRLPTTSHFSKQWNGISWSKTDLITIGNWH